MNYYKLGITEEYKVWNKYFTFDYEFFYRNKEIDFTKAYKDNKLEKIKIKALSEKGLHIDNQSFLKKDIPPLVNKIDNIFIFRDDIIQDLKQTISEFNDVKFIKVTVSGNFKNDYYMLCFSNVIDCVDFGKSTKSEFDFFSNLVLDKTKIPINSNGFFLSEWSEYGQYTSIVSETLKNQLLNLTDMKKFLVFDNVCI